MIDPDHFHGCYDVGPYVKVRKDKYGKPYRTAAVCNRPAGHAGDHWYGNESGGFLCAWNADHHPIASTSPEFVPAYDMGEVK